MSLPYINRAGVLTTDDAVATALIDAAVKLADELEVKYLELRHQAKAFEHDAFNFTRDEKCGWCWIFLRMLRRCLRMLGLRCGTWCVRVRNMIDD